MTSPKPRFTVRYRKRGRPSNAARQGKRIIEEILQVYELEFAGIYRQLMQDLLVYGQVMHTVCWESDKPTLKPIPWEDV